MDASKFRTNINRDGTIKLPPHLMEKIDPATECEIVVRPLRRRESRVNSIEEAIRHIEESMDARYPNLKTKIIPQLRKVIGISKDVNPKYSQYSDREIAGMARMEKHLEKGEILESLY